MKNFALDVVSRLETGAVILGLDELSFDLNVPNLGLVVVRHNVGVTILARSVVRLVPVVMVHSLSVKNLVFYNRNVVLGVKNHSLNVADMMKCFVGELERDVNVAHVVADVALIAPVRLRYALPGVLVPVKA